MITRRRHLQDEALFDCYLAERSGEPLDPRLAEHLTDCGECRERYAEITRFSEVLSVEAALEADALFTPERLRALQQHIARRLEHAGHPARVIAFPCHPARRRTGHAAPRIARRWVAASLAAGMFIGVGTGLMLDWGALRAPTRGTPGVIRQALRTVPHARGEATRPQVFEADDVFLSELELAGERPRILALSAVDALTPHVREINLR